MIDRVQDFIRRALLSLGNRGMKYVRITITTVLILTVVGLAIFFFMPGLQLNTTSPEMTSDSLLEAADLVVAASDSPHKELADYVCDGISDEIEIQAAIDTLPSDGGTVLLLEGTYTIDGVPTVHPEYRSIIILKDNVSLVGSGPTTILKLADYYETRVAGIIGNSKYPVIYNNVRIANLQVDGNKSGVWETQTGIYLQTAHDSIVENNVISSCTNHGIQIYSGSRRVTVRNNTVQRSLIGIYVDTVSDIVVTGNTVQDNQYYNIWLDAAHYSTVRGNVLVGGQIGIGLVRASNNNTIIGNTIERPSGDGIEIKSDMYSYEFGDGVRNNTISENSISFSGRDGISIVNTPSDVLAANDCNIIINNTISGSKHHGISLVSDHNLIKNNLILESSQESNNEYDGIFLYDGASYNEIAGNVLRNGAGVNKPRYGINISEASCVENVVRDNDLRNSGHTGNLDDAGTNTEVQQKEGN
ncbi:nitrous oxide reductase family maturation protein NosD [Chloroflexota bacterium]